MNDHANIERVAARHGGVAIQNTLNDLVSSRCESMIDGYSKLEGKGLLKPFPTVHFCIINNSQVNAFACHLHDDCYLIALYSGLVEKVSLISLNYAEHRRIKEEKEKMAYWAFILDRMISFVLEHELTHILSGHVDYLRNKYCLDEFLEVVNNDKVVGELNHIKHVLEMDADSCAVSRLCLSANETLKRGMLKQAPEYGYWSSVDAIWLQTFSAVWMVFRMFGDGDYKNTSTTNCSHPQPRIRQLIISNVFSAVADEWDIEIDIKKFYEDMQSRFAEIEEFFVAAYGYEINMEVFDDKYYKRNPAYLSLGKSWKDKVRDELSQYTYTELAKPTFLD